MKKLFTEKKFDKTLIDITRHHHAIDHIYIFLVIIRVVYKESEPMNVKEVYF